MSNFIYILQQTLFFMVPLLIVALGALYSERSGIVNIALEGIMIMGAFVGTVTLNLLQYSAPFANLDSLTQGQFFYFIALLVAGITGILFSLLHAFASVHMRADQTISGTALNILAPAIAIYTARSLSITNYTQHVQFESTQLFISKVPLLHNIPLIGDIFFRRTYITTYIAIIIFIVAYIVLYRTRFGLRLRACGEHPQAADSAGIKVERIRYAGVLISGFLAGIGGLTLIVSTTSVFNGSVAGYGFLAIAVLIFGQWKPLRILVAAFFFGMMNAVAHSHSLVPGLNRLPLPSDFYNAIPYVATLILLAFTSKKSQAPRAVGEIYDPGKR